jgi:hypothetical protein
VRWPTFYLATFIYGQIGKKCYNKIRIIGLSTYFLVRSNEMNKNNYISDIQCNKKYMLSFIYSELIYPPNYHK